MKNYKARFFIDGGVVGLGPKRPERYEQPLKFTAKEDLRAYKFSMHAALTLATNHLSNPHTGETRVTLSRLESDEGEIDLKGKKVDIIVDSLSHFLADTHPRYSDGRLLMKCRRKLHKKLAAQ